MKNASKKLSSYMAKSRGMKSGGSLEMVEKDGKKVPAFAADGKGKMKAGGAMHKMPDGTMMRGKKHKMAAGGAVKKKADGGDILGTLSPLAGIVSGKGLFGKLAKSGAGFGVLGAAAALRDDAKKKRSPATTAGAKKAGGTMTMRGAGAATKGKKFYRNG